MLPQISKRFRLDAVRPADSPAEVERLKAFAPVGLPDDYLALVREGADFEFAVEGGDYLRIWGAAGCIEMNEAYAIKTHIPFSLGVGDNERGAALIFAPRAAIPGYYLTSFGCLDLEEARYVAASLTELLVNEVGIEVVA